MTEAARPGAPARLHVRERDTGGLPTVRFERTALRRAARRRDPVTLRRFPLRRNLEVDLELEPFTVTRGDTRSVLGRRGGADVPLDFDPAEVTLLRDRVKDRPGSRVVLALRDGRHTGSIDLGPGQPRFWAASKGPRGETLDPDHATVFEAAGATELPPGVPFCGVEGDELGIQASALLGAEPLAAPLATIGPAVGLLHVELAVDTDYELFQLFEDATCTT